MSSYLTLYYERTATIAADDILLSKNTFPRAFIESSNYNDPKNHKYGCYFQKIDYE